MSEVRLVVRDAEQDLHGTCHGSDADRLVAALAAEPETIEELDLAVQRYLKPREWSFFQGFRRGINDEPWDAGIVIIDLAARLVACESTYSSPGHEGEVQYHDGHQATDLWLWYRLSADWRFTRNILDWQGEADPRRTQRAAQPPLDTRAVFYGRPALEFLAAEALAKARLLREAGLYEERAAEAVDQGVPSFPPDPHREAEYEAVRDIHARWLTTPRNDLRGQAPRDVLLARRNFIDLDLQHRGVQWSHQGECPRGLAQDSHAFRFAGFGTHEIVTYYELVRHVLWSCWERLAEPAGAADLQSLTTGDFLTAEVPRLERVRDEWLQAPDPEHHGLTPREIIDHERARLPESMSGHDAMIDDDCPLCQMLGDMPGPMFWHLDGCNMDDDFAFSFHVTREEWEQERRKWEEHGRRFREEWAEKERLGVQRFGEGYTDPDYLWRRSFVAEQTDGEPLELRLFGIGSNLAELIVDLRNPPKETDEPQTDESLGDSHARLGERLPREERRPRAAETPPLIDRLNRDFGNLREVARSTDLDGAADLLEPVLDRFCETLAAVATARDELRPKCDDLAGRLRRFLEPPSEVEDAMDPPGDDDIPF